MSVERFRAARWLHLADEPMSLELLLRVQRGREPGLAEHVDHVRENSVELGRRLLLSEDELEVLDAAAQLHDIGKLAIPDAILSKPGRLDLAEWGVMRRHTVIGELLIGLVPGMGEVARVVRSCHERWDGAGYPDGLSGEEIPLGARIVFIADALDAMTSNRPYKPAMSEEVALEEIRSCAGTQFDPELVEAFADVVQPEPLEALVG